MDPGKSDDGVEGRGGKIDEGMPDERTGGGKAPVGKEMELNRFFKGGNSDPSEGVTWMTISIFALYTPSLTPAPIMSC